MGLTAFNRKRAEQNAGQITQAQAHLDTANRRVEDLAASLELAKAHQARMLAELEALQPAEAKPKATKKKATKKKVVKKAKGKG